jgi:3-deoxy-7-phosphoheptulonate synthase
MAPNGTAWTPSSWRSKPIKQEVIYEDKDGVTKAVSQLSRLPPIVTPHEIVRLKNNLRDVALGNAFLLQGGDCAELFDYCNQDMIEAKVKLILQMSLVLIYGGKKKVVRIARMAGQYAKPRSSPIETVNGVSMPSFKGDIVNSYEADPVARIPDPSRLLQAYQHSSATLNYLRAAIDSGLADLHAPMDWSLGHVLDPTIRQKYAVITEKITDTLDMMKTIGLDTGSGLEKVELYTSHEGLLLDYEQPLTRLFTHPKNAIVPSVNMAESASNGTFPMRNRKTSLPTRLPRPPPPNTGYYNTSAHFLWIGDRTRQLTHAHVEFFRGLSNPIGVKVGPTMLASELAPLLDIINPHREIGKVVLISRYGANKIAQYLPEHIKAVKESGHVVVWQCDPMHGNGRNATVQNPDGSTSVIKTRRFQDILSELQQALQIHKQMDSYLGGMHLELTGEAVTECVGGAGGLKEEDLNLNYTTFCDPRLNVSDIYALHLASGQC